MKIAYVGDFLNHGRSVSTTGTPIVYLLSDLEGVERIDIFCPEQDEDAESWYVPEKVEIRLHYSFVNPFSLMRLLFVNWKKYDLVIFNMLPTSFGKSSIGNVIGLDLPFIIKNFFKANIVVIYHNSTFTNDVSKLGYNSTIDKLRFAVLRFVEMAMFRTVPTYVLLNIYKELIEKKLPVNNVHFLNIKFLEGVTTIYLNNLQDTDVIHLASNKSSSLRILLHGFWGPQKDLELALSSLLELRQKGLKFYLTVGGTVSRKFPLYRNYFNLLISKYRQIIDQYLGYINEKDIFDIFTSNDLILLPYNVPGGRSGVLETAIFFERKVIAIDFPEYREQSGKNYDVELCPKEDFVNKIEYYVKINSDFGQKKINSRFKMSEARNGVKSFLEQALRKDSEWKKGNYIKR